VHNLKMEIRLNIIINKTMNLRITKIITIIQISQTKIKITNLKDIKKIINNLVSFKVNKIIRIVN